MTVVNFIYTQNVADFVRLNKLDRAGIEEKVSSEMVALSNDGLENPLDLMMHVFEWNGQEFIITGGEIASQRVLFVDLCEYTDGPEIEDGPFKGKKLAMPMPLGAKDEALAEHPAFRAKKETRH